MAIQSIFSQSTRLRFCAGHVLSEPRHIMMIAGNRSFDRSSVHAEQLIGQSIVGRTAGKNQSNVIEIDTDTARYPPAYACRLFGSRSCPGHKNLAAHIHHH